MNSIILILLAVSVISSPRLLAQKSVDYRAFDEGTVVIGQLGVPLGTVVQIDATVVAGSSLRFKIFDGKYLLKVSKVGASSVSNPPTCFFRIHPWDEVKIAPDAFSLYELKKGKKTGSLSDSEIAELERGYVGKAFHLLVYEKGEFSGVPKGLPNDYRVWADVGFGFETHLIVLRIVEESGKPNSQGQANEKQSPNIEAD